MIDLKKKFSESPFYLMVGDSLARLKELPDNSIDSIVTDPPYGLGKEPDALQMLTDWIETGHHEIKSKGGFMNKEWDAFVPQPVLWQECLRVLKPGGHLVSFAGTRTYDLVVLGLRLAGFEIRDQLAWIYGSGMPKSLDVSKAIDKLHGADREVVGKRGHPTLKDKEQDRSGAGGFNNSNNIKDTWDITAPATPDAQEWDGWKSSLKPALEPIVLARKPLEGTIAKNVLKWHTGALNIDACRVDLNGDYKSKANGRPSMTGLDDFYNPENANIPDTVGRFPSNVVHDGSDEVTALFPDSNGAGKSLPQVKITGYGEKSTGTGKSDYIGGDRIPFDAGTGSASRFFYCAKATSADRHSGLENPGPQFEHGTTLRKVENTDTTGNTHPTVKPLSLMCWLVRMVTPVGSICLDPFNGSGSTGKACMVEGMQYVGVDLSQEYVDISTNRIKYALDNKTELYNEVRKIKQPKKITQHPTQVDDSSLTSLFE